METAIKDNQGGNQRGTNTPSLHIDPNRPFAFGIIAVIIGLALAVFIPDPSPFQKAVFTVVIGLGGAGFATAISGFLEVNSKWVTAGGSLGVFVFICIFIWQTTNPSSGTGVPASDANNDFTVDGSSKSAQMGEEK